MEAREVKAVELTGDSRITFGNGVWSVPSQDRPSVRYEVNPSQANPSCTCDDFALRGAVRVCKHVEAVRLLLERQAKGDPVPVAPPRPTRQTYRQHWPEYNAAQQNEKDHFQELLFDLCSAIPQPPRKNDGKNGGRKPVRLGDAVFAAVFKVWSTISARRFMCDLREAHRRGFLARTLSYNPLFKCLESPETTAILRDLIVRSSLPLRSVETVFAPDSSGFGTSKYVKWFDEKYGVERSKCAWVKAHVCAGVKTGVITAVVIGDKDAADCPQFKGLVETTAENFTVKAAVADKAYLSYDNLQLVENLGGTAYIPFKSNSVLGATPLWDKMFHYFQYRREDFLRHYHARSNVESVFSAVKRKYGDSVRSRTEPAMVNEVLAKLVCHNLSCVIHAWYELGIDPRDWGMPKREPSTEAEPPATLRFPGGPTCH